MATVKAGLLAGELRRIAGSLDFDPGAEICAPLLAFHVDDEKEHLLALARLLPRPLTKSYEDFCGSPAIQLSYNTEAIRVWVKAPRDLACRIVKPAQPAEYDCDPLLSPDEDAQLVEEVKGGGV